ncbi:AAA family ATPase [Bacillus pseudomycoides]|uniref:AAA family ATPase n=1 Tax=Bacillus pseudomycoides TaxID=64104 RepID=UPI000BFE1E52|nr:AAA family ATPase [Bacillus pseudomycoides]PGR99923.1 endonuclease [Bacillus pseudomycoides]
MVKVDYVRVKNFRSILDTGNLYLDNNLTVLAGKNESGKSNVLKALEAFNNNIFTEEDIPEGFHNGTFEDVLDVPEVSVCLNFSSNEVFSALLFNENLNFSSKSSSLNLIVTRYGGDYVEKIQGSLYDSLFNKDFERIRVYFNDYLSNLEFVEDDLLYNFKTIKDCVTVSPFGSHYNLINIENEISRINEYMEIFLEHEGFDESLSKIFDEILERSKSLTVYINNVLERIKELGDIFIPKFILFNSFDDMLPDVFNYTNEDSKIVERFFKIVNMNPIEFSKAKGLKRKRLTNKFSANITEEFEGYYNQNEIKLECSLDGNDLYFSVYDGNSDIPFRPGQRSKGFQWFLSFFLTLKAEANTNYVLLLDEPGLYLHAKAQNDVLKVLESLSDSNQIIMTTHSPYLIDSSRLERIRLVLKNENGNTYIENKIHKGADKDTLTPVITSIGLDLSGDLVFSRNCVNILVEGISDYYYLEALKTQLKIPGMIIDEFRFIPNVGATQIPNLAVLLVGWGLDFLVILDNDKEGRRVEKTLLDKLLVDPEKIIFIKSIENYSIEDMFSKEDFSKYVLLEDYNKNNQESNSKKASSGKALLAKKFNELCHINNLNFDQETINNFTELFTKLSFAISNKKTSLPSKD